MNEQLKEKIKIAAAKLDKIVDFAKIAGKIQNKPIRFFVAGFELVDGAVFKVAITEVVDIIPDGAHGVVESWLDAFIDGDWLLLVNSTGAFLGQLNLIPFIDEADEVNVYIALLTALVRLIPQVTRPEAA